MSSKINFIHLTKSELSSKIALLVLNKARIIFWKNSPKYFEGKVISNEKNLIIKTLDLPIRITDELICLNFSINQMEYFLKGKVLTQKDELEELEIILQENCFRVEKRDFARVQVYPHLDVYAYLKYSEVISENIFFINKNDRKKVDLFTNVKEYEKQKIVQIYKDLEAEENQELIGFRVEDVSSNGLCFLASQKEKKEILEKLENNTFSMVLSFGNKNYDLKNAKIVYQINYINHQFSGVNMFKIGITFDENSAVKEKIKEITGYDDRLLDYQKEFEEFIKNE